MISINDYIKQTIMFTNSLVIKSLGSAIAFNRELVKISGIGIPNISADKKTWRYFMNIAGQKHYSNSDVQVFVSELNDYRSLTKELLELYPITKKDLLANGDTYTALIEDYPNDRLYIHGCLYPVDIQTAIDADDGTILAYNPNYVEDNEYSLIRELNQFTTTFFKRWYIKEYTLIDDLYMATVMANLYVAIPNKIINIRLSKVLTPEVHSFHMEHFFRSNMDLWTEAQALTPATRMWLYKNLNYLKHHIGKNATLDTIIEKILTPNNIGLGSYIIRNQDVKLNLNDDTKGIDTIGINEPLYIKQDSILSSVKLNNLYEADNNKVIDNDSVINLEIDLVKSENGLVGNTDREKWIRENAIAELSATNTDRQNTKVLEFSTGKLIKMYGVDIYKVILDHWVYFIENDTIGYYVEYTDPNTNRIYALSPKGALLVMLKYLLVITGNPNLKLTTLNYSYILNPDKNSLYTIYSKLTDDGLTDKLLNMLYNIYPNASTRITSRDDTCDYIQSVVEFFTACWFADANSASTCVSSNIKHILQLATIFGSYAVSDKPEGETIDELLLKENLYLDVDESYDIILAIEELFDAACKIKIDASDELVTSNEIFISLVNKLTSYTVQAINSSTTEEKIYVFYNNLDIYRTMKGIIQVKDGILVPYDRTYIHIKSYGNSFVDEIHGEFLDTDTPSIIVQEFPINGYMFIIDKTISQINPDPILILEVHDYPVIDVSEVEYYVEYITEATGKLVPYVKARLRHKGTHNQQEDVPIDDHASTGLQAYGEYNTLEWNVKSVSGYGFVADSNEAISDSVLYIEVLPDME